MEALTHQSPRGRPPRPRVVHLADYGGSYLGSFIPMLITLGQTARDDGWSVEFVFSELARQQPWLSALATEGLSYRFLDVTRTGLGRWASWLVDDTAFGYRQGRLTAAISALLAEGEGPTVLHTHFSSFDVATTHAARARPNVSVVWHEHSTRRSGWKPTLGGVVMYRRLARTVDRFLCVAPHVTASIGGLAGRDRVTFVPNAIDVDRFRLVTPAERSRARAQLGVGLDETVLLHFGSHWLTKGGDHYLGAVSALESRGSSRALRPITVGRDDARAAVAAFGMQSTVSVLDPIEDVRVLYAAADVLVSPSRTEGMPFAVLEALASGVPVVASDVPGHRFIGEQVAACRLTDLDAASIAASVASVLGRDAAHRSRETAEARQWVVDNMSLTAWAKTVMAIYRHLVPEAAVLTSSGDDGARARASSA